MSGHVETPNEQQTHNHWFFFRLVKEIKVTISHLLFNSPSLSACSGPSLPLSPLTPSLPLHPPSILSSFSLSLSLRPMLCLMNRPSASVSSVIHLVVHPLSHKPTHTRAHTHAQITRKYCRLTVLSHTYKQLNTAR